MSPTTAALDDAAWQGPWRSVRVGEKVALSGGLLLTTLLVPPWPGCALVALICLILLCGPARIPPRTVAWAVAAPWAFLVIGGVTVAVVVGGNAPADAVLSVGPAWADAATLQRGASVIARGVAGTLAILVLATTTPMVDLLTWLRARGVPAPLTDIASLTYRLLFVLLDSALAIRAAQLARLGRPSVATAASAMGALLIRSWTQAARLHAGLAGRGYTDDLPTLPRTRPASPRLWAWTCALLALVWLVALGTGLR